MKNLSIAGFCEKFNACSEGKRWALSLGIETMAELWKRNDLRAEWRVWIFSNPGVACEKDQRLFAVWCARQVQHLMTDPRSIATLDVAERYANSEATAEELAAARAAAWDAARDAAWDAATAAARDAAWDAATAAQNAELLRRFPQLFEE